MYQYINDTTKSIFSDNTKLVVIGGQGSAGILDRVEAFDLEDTTTRVCSHITDYPLPQFGMAVGIIGDVVKSCGGNQALKKACYDYHPTNNSWVRSVDMMHERYFHGHSFIDDMWLLSGGDNGGTLTATEMWTGSAFEAGPPLPQGMFGHCQLTVNHTHVFFATKDQKTNYLLYWPDKTWMELPAMTKSYEWPIC